jgi:hypothetical protein
MAKVTDLIIYSTPASAEENYVNVKKEIVVRPMVNWSLERVNPQLRATPIALIVLTS